MTGASLKQEQRNERERVRDIWHAILDLPRHKDDPASGPYRIDFNKLQGGNDICDALKARLSIKRASPAMVWLGCAEPLAENRDRLTAHVWTTKREGTAIDRSEIVPHAPRVPSACFATASLGILLRWRLATTLPGAPDKENFFETVAEGIGYPEQLVWARMNKLLGENYADLSPPADIRGWLDGQSQAVIAKSVSEEEDNGRASKIVWRRTISQGSFLILTWLNQNRPAGSAPMTEAEFSRPLTGPHAVEEFMASIQFRRWKTQFTPASRFISADSEDRQALEQRVQKWIGSDNKDPRTILFNIHHRCGMWRGLGAFGARIDEMYRCGGGLSDDRECFFLPLGPVTGARRDPPSSDRMLEVLAYLREIFDGDRRQIDKPRPIASGEDFAEVLQRVRAGMIRRPSILILAGVHVSTRKNSVDLIERISAGNSTLGIVSRLMDPELASVAGPEDLEALARNRIIILSDQPILLGGHARSASGRGIERDGHGWNVPFPPAEDSKWDVTVELPEPAHDARQPGAMSASEEVIRNHGFPEHQIDTILQLREALPEHLAEWTDLEYFAFSSALTAIEMAEAAEGRTAIGDLGATAKGKLLDNLDRRPSYRPVLGLMVEHLGILEQKILFLISLVPEGLRLSTVGHLLSDLLRVQDDIAAASRNDEATSAFLDQAAVQIITVADIDGYRIRAGLPAASSRHDVIFHAGDYLAETFQALLTRSKVFEHVGGDWTPGFDHAPDGLELYEGVAAWQVGRREDSQDRIAINFPEFRATLRRLLSRKWPHAYKINCRILAFIALQQHSVAIRHDGIPDGHATRPFRRLFAGIMYGLQSLPVDWMQSGKDWFHIPQISPVMDDLFSTQPDKRRSSKDLYHYLLTFAFRKQADFAPQFLLTRTMGAGRIKIGILRAFEMPWELTPDPFVNQHQKRMSLVWSTFPPDGDPAQVEVISAHLTSMISAYLACGIQDEDFMEYVNDLRTVLAIAARTQRRAAEKLADIDQGKIRFERERMSLIKRRFDVFLNEGRNAKEIGRRISFDLRDFEDRTSESPLIELLGRPAAEVFVQRSRLIARLIIGELLDLSCDYSLIEKQCRRVADEVIGRLEGPWRAHGQTANGMSEISDLLYRLADVLSVEAERIWAQKGRRYDGVLNHGWMDILESIDLVKWTFAPTPDRPNTWALVVSALSLAMFQIAEQIRLKAWRTSPTSSAFHASSQPMQQFVRMALKMEKFRQRLQNHRQKFPYDELPNVVLFPTPISSEDAVAREGRERAAAAAKAHSEAVARAEQGRVLRKKATTARVASGAAEPDSYLVRLARYGIEVISNHHYRFESERASSLLLEADMLRILFHGNDDISIDALREVAGPSPNVPMEQHQKQQERQLEYQAASSGEQVTPGDRLGAVDDAFARKHSKRGRALLNARDYLAASESVLLSFGHMGRRRDRLALQRAKVHRELARFFLDYWNLPRAEFYANLASHDVHFLTQRHPTAGGNKPGLWQRIAYHQKGEFEELMRSIDARDKKMNDSGGNFCWSALLAVEKRRQQLGN